MMIKELKQRKLDILPQKETMKATAKNLQKMAVEKIKAQANI